MTQSNRTRLKRQPAHPGGARDSDPPSAQAAPVEWSRKLERSGIGSTAPFHSGEMVRAKGFFRRRPDGRYYITPDADGRYADSFEIEGCEAQAQLVGMPVTVVLELDVPLGGPHYVDSWSY